MSEIEREIMDEIFSNSKVKLIECPTHGFFVQYPNGKQFALQDFQPVLKKLLDNKLIISNKGLRQLLKYKSKIQAGEEK